MTRYWQYEQAKRDALAALLHWRRTETSGHYADADWASAIESLRDAADRLIEGEAYRVAEFRSTQIVTGDEPAWLPCGHRDEDLCVACAETFDIIPDSTRKA